MRVVRLLAIAVLALVLRPQPAAACGACIPPQPPPPPPPPPTGPPPPPPPEAIYSVESHRMAVSLSTEQTTLWDQIRYSGDPGDFAWVLPVPSAAVDVALADAAFFDELEGQTAPVVASPLLALGSDCAAPPFGVWYDGDDVGGDDSQVTVFSDGVVGPYETVTIGASDPNALHDWLVAHGYNVSDEAMPTIAWYVARHSLFVVLRLAPGVGVDAMQPVRVRYPGYMASFPLRMVTVGAAEVLSLSLWIVAEQRYEAANYPTLTIDPARLVWDWDAHGSNYKQLFADTIEQDGAGRAWIAEYAAPLSSLSFTEAATLDLEEAKHALPYPYVTRLRTRMLVDHFDQDLELRPSADSADVWNYLQAEASIGTQPIPECPDWNGDGLPDTVGSSGGCSYRATSGARDRPATIALLLLALGAAVVVRRPRR